MDMTELLADLMPTPAAEGTENAAPKLEETETEQTAETETETETEEQSPEGDAEDEGEAKDKADEDDKSKDEDAEDDEDKPKREPRSRRMKRQLEALRAENAALKAQSEGSAEKAPANPAPKFEDFNGDFDKYDSARIAWAAREAVREQHVAEREASARNAQVELQQEMLQEFQASQERARKALPDFDQVLAKASNAPVAPHVGQLIIESDKAALLQYHLAQRPELLSELNSSSQIEAARRIGRLEARLAFAKPKTATQAPPPPATKPRGAATPSSENAQLDAWLSQKYGKRRS